MVSATVDKLLFVRITKSELFRGLPCCLGCLKIYDCNESGKNVGQWDSWTKLLTSLVSNSCLSQGCPKLSQAGTNFERNEKSLMDKRRETDPAKESHLSFSFDKIFAVRYPNCSSATEEVWSLSDFCEFPSHFP